MRFSPFSRPPYEPHMPPLGGAPPSLRTTDLGGHSMSTVKRSRAINLTVSKIHEISYADRSHCSDFKPLWIFQIGPVFTTDVQTVNFFNPSPILICINWIRSSPDLQNFWKLSVQSSPDMPMSIHVFYFTSWGKIDTVFWHFQNLTRKCLFCYQRQKHCWSYLLSSGKPGW